MNLTLTSSLLSDALTLTSPLLSDVPTLTSPPLSDALTLTSPLLNDGQRVTGAPYCLGSWRSSRWCYVRETSHGPCLAAACSSAGMSLQETVENDPCGSQALAATVGTARLCNNWK